MKSKITDPCINDISKLFTNGKSHFRYNTLVVNT